MDEITGFKDVQCPYCHYQLIQAGNESPGVDEDGRSCTVRQLFFACTHCGLRTPIAEDWNEARKMVDLIKVPLLDPQVDAQIREAVSKLLAATDITFQSYLKKIYGDDLKAATLKDSNLAMNLDLFGAAQKMLTTIANKQDGWREAVDYVLSTNLSSR